MNNPVLGWIRGERDEVIACFGRGRLMKRADGRFEFRDGTTEDLAAAREWISLFLHEAIIGSVVSSQIPSTGMGTIARRRAP
ncbi:MAG TPA: hypothetical protein P5186_00895 [Candidatus Paceibacterota bacterium]|nr:hypothetical protein [Verrucomicrobiota bacterium]HRY46576.1 hypothetical protein [Candidatus Paceibacterota bacterium]HSA02644.1 hypothetical protein [Candidatus Paceibacterota bacterium]